MVAHHITFMMARGKFALLLASLLLVLGLQPFLHHAYGPVRALDLLLPLVLLAGVLAVSGSRRLLLIGAALAIPAFVLQGTNLVVDFAGAVTLMLGFYVAFIGYVSGTVVYLVVRGDEVTLDTIIGSTCGYLLLGLLFALVCALVEWLAPGSYLIPETSALRSADRYEFRSLIYFSFVTLTTLGYGDIHPLSSPARALAVAEAVIGQLYLTILIARLIGMHISQRRGLSE